MQSKKLFALPQRLPYQADFPMFQVAQAAMNDARGAAGCSRSKIILLDYRHGFSATNTLPRNGNAVDPAAYYQNIKVLAFGAHAFWTV